MAGKRLNLRGPVLQLIIVAVVVMAGYFWLIQPVEVADDVEICGSYAYLVAGRDGLWIVDASAGLAKAEDEEPKDLQAIGHYDSPGSANQLFVQCAEKEGEPTYVYLADGKRGLRIIDVTDPRLPREIAVVDTPGFANDVVVVNKIAYVADGAKGLFLINVSDPANPEERGTAVQSGNMLLVAVRGKYAYVANNDRQVQMVDVSDPDKPAFTEHLYPAKASIHDLKMVGNDLFLAAGNRGLVIVDWSKPEDFQELFVSNQNGKGTAKGLDIVGSYVYLAAGRQGVRVWDIFDLENPEEIGFNDELGDVWAVAADGKNVFTANGIEGLKVASVKLEVAPEEVGHVQGAPEVVEAVTVKGESIYLASGPNGLHILSAANPGALPGPTTIPLGDNNPAVAAAVEGDYAYVAVRGKGLFRVSVKNPSGAESNIPFPIADPRGVVVIGSHVFVAAGGEGLRVIDYTNPAALREVGAMRPCDAGEANAVMREGDNLYVACGAAGIRLYNIKDRSNPVPQWTFPTPAEARSVYAAGGYAYVAIGEKGLYAVNLAGKQPIPAGLPLVLKDRADQTAFAWSVVVREQRAYVAIGLGGVVQVDISKPAEMKQMSVHDSPGEAKNLALDEDQSHLYIADGPRGLRIRDITNPEAWRPAGLFDPLQQTRAVDVVGSYAYILDQYGDLWVVDVRDPKAPAVVGYSDVWGEDAQDIQVVDGFAYIAAGNQGLAVIDVTNPVAPKIFSPYKAVLAEKTAQTPETYGRAVGIWVDKKVAYVADELIGLWIADVSNPSKIVEKGKHQTLPGALDVAYQGGYAFLAYGKQGLTIANVQNPERISINSDWPHESDRKINIVAVTLDGERAYLADQENGLVILDTSNRGSPSEVGSLSFPNAMDVAVVGNYAYLVMSAEGDGQVIDITDAKNPKAVRTFDVPTAAEDLVVVGRLLYVADKTAGLWIGKIGAEAAIEKTARYITPGMVPLRKMLKSIINLRKGEGKGEEELLEKAWRAGWRMIFEIGGIGLAGTVFWLIFFAQFVLPLRHLSERFHAALRLILYFIRRSGPAVFVENGEIRQRNKEEERRLSPGVVLLDAASGGVLRIATAFTRAIGPGVHFTRSGESLAGTVDLHKKVYPFPFLGPKNDEDPFAPFDLKEGKDAEEARNKYNERQKNRMLTSGKTRDGMEVVPKVSALFNLRGQPIAGGTQFGYDGEAVRQAITREEITRVRSNNSVEVKQVRWFEMPVYLVVDVWREYLQKFTLAELFDSNTAENKNLKSLLPADEEKKKRGMTGFEIIKRMVRERLTKPKVIELNERGELVPDPEIESREYQLLRDMGVEVEFTIVGGLQFPPEVEKSLVDNWIAEWSYLANLERQLVEQRRRLTEHKGRAQALQQFSQAAARLLLAELAKHPLLELADTLELLLRGTLKEVVRDKALYPRLTYEERELSNLIEWVRRQLP